YTQAVENFHQPRMSCHCVAALDIEHHGRLSLFLGRLDIPYAIYERVVTTVVADPMTESRKHQEGFMGREHVETDVQCNNVDTRLAHSLELRQEGHVARPQGHTAVVVPDDCPPQQFMQSTHYALPTSCNWRDGRTASSATPQSITKQT